MSSLSLNIASRLWLGFAAICLVLVAAVGYTSVTLSSVTETAERVTNLRAPTANASADLTAQMNGSLAILRGYLLTGKETLKAERAATWKNIAVLGATMDELEKASPIRKTSKNGPPRANFSASCRRRRTRPRHSPSPRRRSRRQRS